DLRRIDDRDDSGGDATEYRGQYGPDQVVADRRAQVRRPNRRVSAKRRGVRHCRATAYAGGSSIKIFLAAAWAEHASTPCCQAGTPGLFVSRTARSTNRAPRQSRRFAVWARRRVWVRPPDRRRGQKP